MNVKTFSDGSEITADDMELMNCAGGVAQVSGVDYGTTRVARIA